MVLHMIITHPDDRLRIVSAPVTPDWEIANLAYGLALEAMNKAKGVGISGIQIGVPYRFFWMKDENGHLELVVNPKSYEGIGFSQETAEGCLSFPGTFQYVKRYPKILAKYERVLFPSTNSVMVEKELTGLMAHVFQHESEHLDGKLFIDHLPERDQKRITNRLKKWKMKGYL
jgi:peptide deformylase